MSQSQRPLSATDTLILKGYVSSPWRHVLPFVWGFLFLWGIASLVSYPLWSWLAPVMGVEHPAEYRTHVVAVLSIAVAAFVGASFAKFMRGSLRIARDPQGLSARARRDLAEGMALTETLRVTAAVEIKEFEDEGAGFFLALDDGRVLCIVGQDLDGFAHDATGNAAEGIEDERAMFPQTRIAYTYGPHSKIRLHIIGEGKTLRPRAVVETSAKQFKRDGGLPEDGTFYNGPLESVLKRFGYTEKPVPAVSAPTT